MRHTQNFGQARVWSGNKISGQWNCFKVHLKATFIFANGLLSISGISPNPIYDKGKYELKGHEICPNVICNEIGHKIRLLVRFLLSNYIFLSFETLYFNIRTIYFQLLALHIFQRKQNYTYNQAIAQSNYFGFSIQSKSITNMWLTIQIRFVLWSDRFLENPKLFIYTRASLSVVIVNRLAIGH